MTRRSVAMVFLPSVVALLAGLLLAGAAVGVAWAGDVLETDGPDVVGIRSGAAGWVVVGFAVAAGLVALAGSAGLLVSWVLALVVTAQLDDKTWFVVVLVTGLLSLGIVGLALYLIAGPADGRPDRVPEVDP